MSSSIEELISHYAEVHMCVYGPVSKIPFLRKLMKSGMQPLRPHGPFSTISNFCFMKMSTDTFRPGEAQCVPFIHSSLPQSTPRDKRDDERNLEILFSSPTPDIPFISLKLATDPALLSLTAFQVVLELNQVWAAPLPARQPVNLGRMNQLRQWRIKCMMK